MKKSTGIVRRIDELGRVVIPKEIRDTHGMPTGCPLEIFIDGQTIVLKKYQPGCYQCSTTDEQTVHPFTGGLRLCQACQEIMARQLKARGEIILTEKED